MTKWVDLPLDKKRKLFQMAVERAEVMDDKIAQRRHNVMIARRITGMPAQPATEESDNDPANPNPERAGLTPEELANSKKLR